MTQEQFKFVELQDYDTGDTIHLVDDTVVCIMILKGRTCLIRDQTYSVVPVRGSLEDVCSLFPMDEFLKLTIRETNDSFYIHPKSFAGVYENKDGLAIQRRYDYSMLPVKETKEELYMLLENNKNVRFTMRNIS